MKRVILSKYVFRSLNDNPLFVVYVDIVVGATFICGGIHANSTDLRGSLPNF